MKKIKILFLLVFFTTLISCDGSDSYQGAWKALDASGKKFEINFAPTTVSIKDTTGTSKSYEYTQNAFEFKNSTEKYTITFEDGRMYQIYFPKKDETVGFILDENGGEMFTLSRKNYLTFEELNKLN